MKQGEAPWFLMWSTGLLFAFGMVWGWLAIGAARTVTILDTPVRSALLVGTGILGTVLAQSGVLWAWRRYVYALEDVATDRTGSEIIGRASRATPSATTGEARHPGAPSSV
jgi:hypothetical protein